MRPDAHAEVSVSRRDRPHADPRSALERRLLADISRPVERVFASVALLRDELLSIATAVASSGRRLRRRDLEGLRSVAGRLLAGADVPLDRARRNPRPGAT